VVPPDVLVAFAVAAEVAVVVVDTFAVNAEKGGSVTPASEHSVTA
jgi:hypothetical protein